MSYEVGQIVSVSNDKIVWFYYPFVKVTEDNKIVVNKDGVQQDFLYIDMGNTHTFATGAIRSQDANHVQYDLIPPKGLQALAETCQEGYKKYGAHNWSKGFPIGDMLNHAIRHIYLFIDGDTSEPHLAHAAWNILAAIDTSQLHPEKEHQLPPHRPITKAQQCQTDSDAF